MSERKLKEQIAVVSMGCILPDAPNPEVFWHNVLNKKVSIGKSGGDRFDREVHFRPEMYGKTEKFDKTYTEISSAEAAFEFDGRRFRLPPTVTRHMDTNQKVMVLSAEQALSGVKSDTWNREKVSVFVGTSFIGELHHAFQRRTHWDRFSYHLKKHPDFSGLDEQKQSAVLKDLEHRFLKGTYMISEDSAPGVLPNIIASRISSVFDFHGHAYVLDAACASTLAAIIAGVQHLDSGESDVVICGGADLLNSELGRVYFSGINALSPDGSYPFDVRANGFVIGEGGGAVILKRYSDAIADGDQILALIAGYGQNSDGKGKAIAAPNFKWQAKAIFDAFRMAGFSPDTVELIEAHGTATKVGDKSEIDAMKTCYEALGARRKQFCAVGSAKSNIGHLKAAAGVPGFIKAVMSLHHRVLPPTASCEMVNPALQLEGSPFFINTEKRDWPKTDHPRRAGVSGFGFGGANYHIVLEEFREADVEKKLADLRQNKSVPSISTTAASISEAKKSPDAAASGPDDSWLTLLVSGTDTDELCGELSRILSEVSDSVSMNENMLNLVLKENFVAASSATHRLGIVFLGRVELRTKIKTALEVLSKEPSERVDSQWALLAQKGIFYRNTPPVKRNEVAFLFPGQASQYPDMCLSLEEGYPHLKGFAVPMDSYWESHCGTPISGLISSASRGVEATASLLKNTRNTHPALLYGSVLCHEILRQHGVEAGFMVGHSAGEISALQAAGMLNLKNALMLMDSRSRSFVEMPGNLPDGGVDYGKMAAVKTDRETLAALISESGAPVSLANLNSPTQLIVSGFTRDMNAFLSFLSARKTGFVELNVSHAFHSPVVQPAAEQYRKDLESIVFQKGETPVYANETCTVYPDDPAARGAEDQIRDMLYRQITGSVNFMGTIEKLAGEGVRLFVEVGPNQVLSQLTRAILDGKNVSIVPSNPKKKSDMEGMQSCIAALFAEGVAVQYVAPAVGHARPPAENEALPLSPAPVPNVQGPYPRPTIGYSGVSVGLPGSYKRSFRDDNFDQLFAGHNFIEALSEKEKSNLASLRVNKVVKTSQGPSFHLLDSLESVIQLAGKVGQIDALKDYQIDQSEIDQMNQAILHGIAAGFEALRDARIPLVHQYNRTASGGLLPDRWVLPRSMQRRTGVIYAHGFPMVETVVAEVTRHLNYRFAGVGRKKQLAFYHQLLPLIENTEAKDILTNWFVENQAMLKNACSDDEVFKFNHLFINQISSLANVRMAQYIQALGPNFQLNAACSSTCTAITLSEEMIASGRVDRMLIIGSDDATSELSMPYLGAGFLSTGAASCESDVREAALPFDERRNGMIISAGAVALVVERMDAARERGLRPVCQLLGSHVFNTAGHHARLNVPRYADELKYFIDGMAAQYGLNVDALSKNLLYVSHETYTPARGGCSEAEAVSLRHVFKDNFRNILVTNTKGMTGHTMGASVEDVLAARALECGKVPPVVNFRVPDPKLEGLNLSRGGRHRCEFALRMAAGFGSQGNYILLRRYGDVMEESAMVNPLNPRSDYRIEDPGRYLEWLRAVSDDAEPELEFSGRLLRVKDARMGAVVSDSSDVTPVPGSQKEPPASAPVSAVHPFSGAAGEFPRGKATVAVKETRAATRGEIQRLVFSVVAEVTGYAQEMIEADMEVENDLGIDTVKQATILSTLGEKLGVADEFEFQIAAYPTVASWIDLFMGLSAPGETVSRTEITATMPVVTMENDTVSPPSVRHVTRAQIQELVFGVVSEITGYAPEMIEPDMEVENDLGIDTVKQATILGMLGEKLGVADEFEFQIAAYPTVASWIDLFMGLSPGTKENVLQADRADNSPAPPVTVQTHVVPAAGTVPPLAGRSQVTEMVLDVVAEITGYAPEMIEPDMEVENDLGIDTVKQATILGMLGEKLGVADEFEFQIAAYPTVASWIDLFMGLTGAGGEAGVAKTAAAVETEPETDDATNLQGAPRKLNTHYLVRESLDFETATKILAKTTDLKSCRLFIIGPVSRFEMLRSRLHQITGELIHVDLSVNRIEEAVSRVAGGGTLSLRDVWLDLSAYEIGVDVQEMLSAHFDFCKKLDDRRPNRIVSIGRQSPTHGALVGYYQALSKEWNVDYCGVMDGEAHSRISDTALSTAIFALSEWPGAAVVETHPEQILAWRAMDSEEVTDTTDVVGATSATDDIAWQDSDVLLVVGATGITARIAEAFSRQHPVKMALLDLNPLSETSYLGPEWDEENHPARKNDILQRLQAEGGKVRPVVLEQAFQRILKQRELQQNIRLLESNHTTVMYLSCDVTDADAVKQAVNTIQQKLGPITGIIHGAGVEISNMIGKKSREEFLKVTRPKIEGAENLLEFAASDRLKLWLCFSSISGVFGNVAQVDYSAANSFLNSVTLSLQEQNPNVVARCIAWSGWAQTGMAWRNTYVRENAEKIGLHFIMPEEGCNKAVSLMSNTRGPSIQIVHRGLGHMLDNRWQSRSGFPTPLIDRMEKTESGFRFHKKLDVNTDEWLNQHRLLDTPLLPGVGYLEMMAEIFGRNNDFRNGICYENLVFHDAFKLTGEVPREIFIETSVDAGKSGVPVSMKIFSEIRGRLFSDMRLYCTATVSSAGAKPLLHEVWQEPDWVETADHFKVFEGIEKLPQNVIFGNLFHDFKRQGANLDGMRYQWNDQALVRDYGFPMEQLDNPKYPLSDYKINFCLMDSLHQAGVVHTVLQTGKVHLPCGARQFVIYDKCDSPERYRNYARCVRRENDTFWYDIFLTNSRGDVCATVFGCEFRKIS